MIKKITKILFIVPMHITFESFLNPAHNSRRFMKADGKYYNSLSTDLPLGPLSMSAYLKKHAQVEVKLLDFNAEINALNSFPYDSFYSCAIDFLRALDFKPDIVGVSSLFSPSFNNFMDCGKAAKEIFPDAMTIGGGNIPTNSYEYIYNKLNNNYFDALCFGEGEKPLLDLVLADDKHEYLQNSPSWITKNKVAKNSDLFLPKHDFIENLDEIPFFDYDLCDFDKHSSNQVTSSFHSVKNTRGFHIMTSRGCPYLCTFCASHKTHGRKMRYHSIERVKEDFTRLKEKYGASTLVFQDDHLMADSDRVYKILEIVGSLGVEALFQNGLTLYALDRKMLEAFYAAGVRHLVLPVESGSEKVLKEQMKKPLKFRISERVAADCRDLGIYTNTNILIGMPGETVKDLDEGRQNLRKVKTNWFNIAIASPIVGSDMHKLALEKKYINVDTMGADYRKAVIETEDFTPEFIQKYQYMMNLELNFVFNNDVLLGEYELALDAFKNVIRIKPDHAFAHLYAAKCYFMLGNFELYEKHCESYFDSCRDDFWTEYVNKWNTPKTKSEMRDFFESPVTSQ